jgi:hypothetical protein
VYFGDFLLGKKNGQGVVIDDDGVFNGRFVDNCKEGPSRLDHADGTTVVGTWGPSPHFKTDQPYTNDRNPYLEGDPNGEVEVLFADGAFYKGHMTNGRITGGHGVYQSAFNEVLSGHFVHGVLHGKDGMCRNHAGEVFEGTWDTGQLHGEGKYKNDRGDWYEGWFEHGLRHGRGAAKYRDRGFYRGYFAHDMFHGKGELHFSKRLTKREKAKAAEAAAAEADEALLNKTTPHAAAADAAADAPPPTRTKKQQQQHGSAPDAAAQEEKDTPPVDNRSEFRKAFYGYFIADDVANGGIVVNSETHLTRNTSRRNTQLLAPIINIQKKMKKTVQRLRKKIEKFTFMELYVRNDIMRKKARIFRQQRHLTKKTMYALDKREGLLQSGDYDSDDDEAEEFNLNVPDRTLEKELLRERMGARRYRLENTDLDKVRPSKPLVPRLGIVSTDQQTHVSKVVTSITTDPETTDYHRVKRMLPRVAASDFEEAAERQRYLKYDRIWARAEEAFAMKRRSAADDAEAKNPSSL